MSLKEDISRILGPEKVSGAPDVLAAHAGDKWYASVLPEAVVFPESTEDVSLLLRYASSMNIPVTARGGGVWGVVAALGTGGTPHGRDHRHADPGALGRASGRFRG